MEKLVSRSAVMLAERLMRRNCPLVSVRGSGRLIGIGGEASPFRLVSVVTDGESFMVMKVFLREC